MAVTILKLNFRGVYFEVDVNILQRAPDSRLANIARGKERVPMDNEGRHFIDRNPVYFHHILNYYSTGTLDFPPLYSWEAAKAEIDFWRLDVNALSKACVLRYDRERALLLEAQEINMYYERYDMNVRGSMCKGCASVFKGMYDFFDVPRSSIPAMIYSIMVCVFVPLFSIAFHIKKSFPEVKYLIVNDTSGVRSMPVAMSPKELHSSHYEEPFTIFWLTELTILGILLLEMLLRFIAWPSKCRYFADPLNWADLLATLPPLLRWLFLYLELEDVFARPLLTYFLMAFVSFRLFRIFRIWRCYEPYRLLFLAIKYIVKDWFLTLALSVIMFLIFSFVFYAVERDYVDISDTMWLTAITMTTVGYGDMRPLTLLGRLIGGLCLLAAILTVVLPVPALVSSYHRAHRTLQVARALRRHYSGKSKDLMVETVAPSGGNMPMYPVLSQEASSSNAHTKQY